MIESALQSDAKIEAVYFQEPVTVQMEAVMSVAISRGIATVEVQSGTLGKVADSVTSQGLVAVAKFCDLVFSAIETEALIIVLVGVRDPGNVGTIIRTALAAGAGAVILCNQCVDIYNPKSLRSSAGAIFSVPISIVDSFDDVTRGLKERGYRLLGTSSHASQAFWDVDLTAKVALVFGGEANGLGNDEVRGLDDIVTIPIDARAESLNVAMAASILMFETRRQILSARCSSSMPGSAVGEI